MAAGSCRATTIFGKKLSGLFDLSIDSSTPANSTMVETWLSPSSIIHHSSNLTIDCTATPDPQCMPSQASTQDLWNCREKPAKGAWKTARVLDGRRDSAIYLSEISFCCSWPHVPYSTGVLITACSRQRLSKQLREAKIWVGNVNILFNKEATRWLGVWLDS